MSAPRGAQHNDDAGGRALADLCFVAGFTSLVPADGDTTNDLREVHGAAFSRVQPAETSGPTLVAHSEEISNQLGISEGAVDSLEFAEVFTGNRLLEGMDPHAMCYGGHQFGNWAGQLGDGRAIGLGELVDVEGVAQMLQLKGAGPTPYSRGADGLAVLRSSVREFLCSEAMHHLGVPTTRALSLALTGDQVTRDMFYDGNPSPEPGAVVCRVAPSFLRFGSYQLPAARNDLDLLRQLADYTIEHHFEHLIADGGAIDAAVYSAWFEEVCSRTATLMVDWMRVGFVHGVMNTDNLSILGLTIDYGPYGWLEDYDPDWTPNTTDAGGRRYRFGHQPQIAHWNLVQLANAVYPLVDAAEPLQLAIDGFGDEFHAKWATMMASKLGMGDLSENDDEAAGLFDEVLEILQVHETDMTIFFRRLADVPCDVEVSDDELLAPLVEAYYEPETVSAELKERTARWLRSLNLRVLSAGSGLEGRPAAMNCVNPKYVLRNYLAQLAIDNAEAGDFGLVAELLDTLRRPYDEQPEREAFAAKRPDWARTRAGCSMLSCSS